MFLCVHLCVCMCVWGGLCERLYIHHLVVCLTTGPKPLPQPALHIVRSRASFFKWEHPLLSLRSSSSFLRLLPRLPVTSIPPFIFPSITRCRRQFLSKMWPIQLAFRLLISRRIYPCPLTLNNTNSVCVCVCVHSGACVLENSIGFHLQPNNWHCYGASASPIPVLGTRFSNTVRRNDVSLPYFSFYLLPPNEVPT